MCSKNAILTSSLLSFFGIFNPLNAYVLGGNALSQVYPIPNEEGAGYSPIHLWIYLILDQIAIP